VRRPQQGKEDMLLDPVDVQTMQEHEGVQETTPNLTWMWKEQGCSS